MELKYRIESLSFMSCKKCSKELLKNLSKLPMIKNVAINFDDGTVMIESDDIATKEQIDAVVDIIEKESYCSHHRMDASRTNTYSYNDVCGEMNEEELRKELEKDERLDSVMVNKESKLITVTHHSNIDSYLVVSKLIRSLDSDVILEEPEVKITKIRNEKKIMMLIAYAFGIVFFVLGCIFKYALKYDIYALFSFIASYLFLGYQIFIACFQEFKERNIFNEELLMIIASIGALATKEEVEAIALVILYIIGEYLERIAEERSEKSIEAMMNLKVDEVTLESGQVIPTKDAVVGDIIVIRVGDLIPLDGVVVSGASLIDTKKMTGESLPVEVSKDSPLLSGTLNLKAVLKMRVLKEEKDSEANKLSDLIKEAETKKSHAESFITKFSKFYTPSVMILAFLVFIMDRFVLQMATDISLNNAFVFLVIGCPCALVISVPLSFSMGIGRASKEAIMVRGSNYLESMAKLKTLVFDKTGTLTEGNFEVQEVKIYNDIKIEEAIKIVASIESYSTHPIARVLADYGKNNCNKNIVTDIIEVPGLGLKAKYDNVDCLIGSSRILSSLNLVDPYQIERGTTVYLVTNNKLAARFTLYDKVKDQTKEALTYLRKAGIKEYMLTGDSDDNASWVSDSLGLDNYEAGLLPDQKLSSLKTYLNKEKRGTLAYVGDGMNDAPSLKLADIGIAMGLNSSEAAKEASDVVILKDDIAKVKDFYLIAKKTHKIAKENIIFALTVKLLIMVLVLSNLLSHLSGFLMILGLLADTGVTLLLILNSTRIFHFKINS